MKEFQFQEIEEIYSEPPSLKKICAVCVSSQLITAVNREDEERRDEQAETKYFNTAMDNVRTLGLPLSLQETVQGLMKPIHKQLGIWYNYCYLPYFACTAPIITQWGMVDIMASVKLLLENVRLSVYFRYVVACEVCLEDWIWKLGKQLSACNPVLLKREYCRGRRQLSTFVRFWHDAYGGFISCMANRPSLPKGMYNTGLQVALEGHGNQHAVEYFLDRASGKAIRRTVVKGFGGNRFCHRFSPSFLRYLFLRLSEAVQLQECGNFYRVMLFALQKPPYVQRFLELARLLTPYINEYTYWELMRGLVREAVASDTDYDCRGAIIEFWQLGEMGDFDFMEWVGPRIFRDIVLDALRSKDRVLIKFVLSKIPYSLSEDLLSLIPNNDDDIILPLLWAKEFRILKMFIGCCARHDFDLLENLRKNALTADVAFTFDLSTFRTLVFFKGDAWESARLRLLEIIDDVAEELKTDR